MPLHAKLFVEPNPVPVKWALAEMGMMPAGLRLPLAPLADELHDTVRGALREAGLLSASLSRSGPAASDSAACSLTRYDMTKRTITHHHCHAAKRGLVLPHCCVSLTGCTFVGSVFESDKLDYRASKKAPPLDIPPDLTQLQNDNRYAIARRQRGVATASGYQQGATPAGTPAVAAASGESSAWATRTPSRSSAAATSAGWWSSRRRSSCGRS